MSVVTKVLTVLLVVLCIAFSMAAISFTAGTENWHQLAEDYRKQARIADAQQRSLMASHAAEKATLRDALKSHIDRINDVEADLEDETERVARQDGQIAQLGADKRRADALAQRLANELGIAQVARAAVQEQRQELETRNIELERRNIDLNERVNELTTQVTVLVQQQRQQEQQVNILREENRKIAQQASVPAAPDMGAGLAGLAQMGARPLTPPTAESILGQVLAVEGDLVTISVGSSDRVRKDAVFVIFRGKQYIGDMVITDVEPDLSAGRLMISMAGLSPRPGDRVQDEYHFAVPR